MPTDATAPPDDSTADPATESVDESRARRGHRDESHRFPLRSSSIPPIVPALGAGPHRLHCVLAHPSLSRARRRTVSLDGGCPRRERLRPARLRRGLHAPTGSPSRTRRSPFTPSPGFSTSGSRRFRSRAFCPACLRFSPFSRPTSLAGNCSDPTVGPASPRSSSRPVPRCSPGTSRRATSPVRSPSSSRSVDSTPAIGCSTPAATLATPVIVATPASVATLTTTVTPPPTLPDTGQSSPRPCSASSS